MIETKDVNLADITSNADSLSKNVEQKDSNNTEIISGDTYTTPTQNNTTSIKTNTSNWKLIPVKSFEKKKSTVDKFKEMFSDSEA
jgi:hypothetical protein